MLVYIYIYLCIYIYIYMFLHLSTSFLMPKRQATRFCTPRQVLEVELLEELLDTSEAGAGFAQAATFLLYGWLSKLWSLFGSLI